MAKYYTADPSNQRLVSKWESQEILGKGTGMNDSLIPFTLEGTTEENVFSDASSEEPWTLGGIGNAPRNADITQRRWNLLKDGLN
jgi:hypothetical protein